MKQPPPASKVKRLKTILTSLRALHDILSDERLVAQRRLDVWFITGKGDEEILGENKWILENTLNHLEMVIEEVERKVS